MKAQVYAKVGDQTFATQEDYDAWTGKVTEAKVEPASFGTEEYKSITVEVNHLVTNPSDERGNEVVIPMLASSKNARQQLLNQIGYFVAEGNPNLLTDDDHFANIAAGLNNDVIYVYTVIRPNGSEQTNVIYDIALGDMILNHPQFGDGSLMGAHKALIALAVDMRRNARSDGKDDALVVFIPNAK